MASETYKGRKITARTRRSRDGQVMRGTVNGVKVSDLWSCTEEQMLAQLRAHIDHVGDVPTGGCSIEWYAPTAVQVCAEGIHAQPPGGPCPHPTCREKDAEPKTPCRRCGTAVGRYTPIGLPATSIWTRAHRAPGSELLCGASDLPDNDVCASMPDGPIRP